jgi:hypothetical protein
MRIFGCAAGSGIECPAMTEPTEPPESQPSKATPAADADAVLFGGGREREAPRSRLPWIVGFAVVLLAVALLALLGRGKQEIPLAADPYAPMLAVEQATMSQAENFAGATITYIDVTVKNNGDRTVVGGVAHAVFRDTLGQVVQMEDLPLRALLSHPAGGAADAADLSMAPLHPGQSRTLRLTLEHISSQWNRAQPEIEFRGLRLQ